MSHYGVKCLSVNDALSFFVNLVFRGLMHVSRTSSHFVVGSCATGGDVYEPMLRRTNRIVEPDTNVCQHSQTPGRGSVLKLSCSMT